MTSSSSAAARPASGSFATPPCGASARSWSSGWTSARAPPAASTGCCTRAGATSSSDPRSATECAEENADRPAHRRRGRSRTPAGFFVTTPADDPDYADRFLAGCARDRACRCRRSRRRGAGARAAASTRASRAPSRCRTRAVDAWKLLWGNAASARAYGADGPHLPLGERGPARRRPGRRRGRPRRPRRRRGAHRGRLHDQRRRHLGRRDRRHGRLPRASRWSRARGS